MSRTHRIRLSIAIGWGRLLFASVLQVTSNVQAKTVVHSQVSHTQKKEDAFLCYVKLVAIEFAQAAPRPLVRSSPWTSTWLSSVLTRRRDAAEPGSRDLFDESSDEEDATCAICLEPLGDAPRMPGCAHRFHAACVLGPDSLASHAWADGVMPSMRRGQRVLCPLCRAPSLIPPGFL